MKNFKISNRITKISLYIKCTLKNTLITLVNDQQKVIYQTSSKSYPIKIKRKNNAYVLQKISLNILKILKNYNKKKIKVKIYINGIGAGRYNIIKHLIKKVRVCYIKDLTNLPFNGCRPKKQKRR